MSTTGSAHALTTSNAANRMALKSSHGSRFTRRVIIRCVAADGDRAERSPYVPAAVPRRRASALANALADDDRVHIDEVFGIECSDDFARDFGRIVATLDASDRPFADVAMEIPGAIRFEVYGAVPDSRMFYACPCGCGTVGSVFVRPFPQQPLWSNMGTKDAPTLQPSIGLTRHANDEDVETDGYHWHGYLVEGVWQSVHAGRA